MAAPTVTVGFENTYSGNYVVVRQLEDYIDNFNPDEFPLLASVGLNSYPYTINNTKIEWQRDEMIPIEDALESAITDAAATTISLDHADYLSLHDVILVDSELMQVVSIDEAASDAVVTRGFAGSTADTHSAGATVYILGNARPEGSSPGWARQTAASQLYNYTQIFDETASITGSEKSMKNHGPDGSALLNLRIDNRMKEMYQKMERALLYNSQRYAGTATAARLSAGMNYWVADKNNLSGAALAYADIMDVMLEKQNSFGSNNVPTQLWCNGFVRAKISSWGAGTVRTARTETVVGTTVDTIFTDFGSLSINMDRLLIPSEVWLLNPDTIMIGPLEGRGFQEWDASVAGDDAEKRRIIGEYAFIVKGEDASNAGLNCKIYGVSTTS